MAGALRSGLLEPVDFSEIHGWADDDIAAAFHAFRRSAENGVLPKTRSLQIPGADFLSVFKAALDLSAAASDHDARHFFEHYFRPYRIRAEGFVTGYFEPVVTASPVRTETFKVPIYGRPPELVDVDEASAPPGWDPAFRFACRSGNHLRPFADRRAIDHGFLAGRGLELAWIEDPVDAYFIQVQGSARLAMTDGSIRRITFAAKTGHPYTSIGRLAVERGILSEDEADKSGLEAWLKANRQNGRALMNENRSFIFFEESLNLGPEDGPVGAAKVPLTPMRSLAVDRALMTFHTPVWVDAPAVAGVAGLVGGLRRLMVAQDTGSAIVGPARGDVFFGSGEEAGRMAGAVRHKAMFIALVPQPV